LKKAQSKLLAVVFDGFVSLVNGPAFEQFLAVTMAEIAPPDLAGLCIFQQLLARPEVRHPYVVSRCGHASPAKSGCQDSQSIFTRINRRKD
jgi:hypothetical protein